MGGNVTFNNVAQVIIDTLEEMHSVSVAVAMIIILLSIYRNYTQFGEMLGMKYVMAVMISIVLIVIFPGMADALFKGMLEWGQGAGKRVEDAVRVLMAVEVEGSWLDKVAAAIANFFYRGAIYVGNFFRDMMILVCSGLFLILKTLSPIFIAMLTVPETKSVSINYLLMVFGFIMTPLVMLFGDLACVWVMMRIWESTGMALAAAAAVGASGATAGSLAVLAASPPGIIVVAAGFAGALIAFAGVFLILTLVMYVGLPWACISLFRGSGIGNALAMTLSLGQNAKTAALSGRNAGKSLGGAMNSIARSMRGSDDGPTKKQKEK